MYVAGARECALQLTETDDEFLDALSLSYKRELLDSLEIVAAGGDCPPDLAKEVEAMRMSPLDEGPGESFHRRTNLTKSRAAASKHPWLIAPTREKQNIDMGEAFLRTHKERDNLLSGTNGVISNGCCKANGVGDIFQNT